MTKPLAIDLFYGLQQAFPQPELLRRQNATVEQGVTRRAQYPEHVPLSCFARAPSTVASELRLVRDIKHACLAAAFAGAWHVRMLSAKPFDNALSLSGPRVFMLMPMPHPTVVVVVSPEKLRSRFDRALTRAVVTAIASVCARWGNIKMLAASKAVTPSLGRVRLLAPAPSPGALRACLRAIQLIWPDGLECCSTVPTKQIVHLVIMP